MKCQARTATNNRYYASEGTMRICPWRVDTLASCTVQKEVYQSFAPCLKDKCMCYGREDGSDGIRREYCVREDMTYERRSKMEEAE